MLPSEKAQSIAVDDREFLTQLYNRYRKVMYYEIYKITQDSWETEDVLQAAILKLSSKTALLRGIDDDCKLATYVLTTARNLARNSIRDRRINQFLSFDDEALNLEETVSDNSSIDGDLIAKERIRDLHSVWKQLDCTSRSLLEGRYILDKSDQELGSLLGTKPVNIRMMLTRARRKALVLITAKDEGIH